MQSRKLNPTHDNLKKLVITINDNEEVFNARNELASNDKETIDIDEETNDDIQTNVNKNNCNEKAVTNINNNNTVLQVNVNNNEITSKETPEHQNKDKDREKMSSSQENQNATLNEKETYKKITKTKKIKTYQHIVKGYT